MKRLSWRVGVTFVVGSAAVAMPAVVADAAAPPPPPLASGHAEIVAQGIVGFPDGTFHWQVADGTLSAGAAPTAVPQAVTFVLSDDGVVDVAGDAPTRLGSGEALMVPALSEALLSTADGSAAYWTLSIANVADTGGVGATGGSFNLAAGQRDVDLVRDVLATGEALQLPDRDVATLLLVTAGSAVAASTDGDSIELADGEAATLDGDLTITNEGEQPTTIVAAVIGTIVPALEVAPQATTPPPPPNTDHATTSTSATTTTSAETTTTMPTDSDGDGLSDVDEMNTYGTDPSNPDTEGDHLTDGDEILVYGTDPLDNNSDDDGLTDGDEINITHTNPNDQDTDDDGLMDNDENPAGADPNNPDTDGDGFNDGTEVASGTNPADANSHP
jgi:hypothetical protein